MPHVDKVKGPEVLGQLHLPVYQRWIRPVTSPLPTPPIPPLPPHPTQPPIPWVRCACVLRSTTRCTIDTGNAKQFEHAHALYYLLPAKPPLPGCKSPLYYLFTLSTHTLFCVQSHWPAGHSPMGPLSAVPWFHSWSSKRDLYNPARRMDWFFGFPGYSEDFHDPWGGPRYSSFKTNVGPRHQGAR